MRSMTWHNGQPRATASTHVSRTHRPDQLSNARPDLRVAVGLQLCNRSMHLLTISKRYQQPVEILGVGGCTPPRLHHGSPMRMSSASTPATRSRTLRTCTPRHPPRATSEQAPHLIGPDEQEKRQAVVFEELQEASGGSGVSGCNCHYAQVEGGVMGQGHELRLKKLQAFAVVGGLGKNA